MPQKIKYDDRRYISRGKFYVLHLDDDIMSEGVEQLNDGKVGHPFVYSDVCFMVTALFRNTVGTGYIIQKHCRYWIQTTAGNN